LAAAGLPIGAICALFLFPYLFRHYRYPLGWDAPATVRRAGSLARDGLDRIGAIRAGEPLLLNALAQATRQNMFTLVAIVPAVLAGVAGLAAAALAHWPFFAFAGAVYLVALAGYLAPSVRSPGWAAPASRLAAPIAVSGAFVALTFLGLPPGGWLGARLGALNQSLRRRLLDRLH